MKRFELPVSVDLTMAWQTRGYFSSLRPIALLRSRVSSARQSPTTLCCIRVQLWSQLFIASLKGGRTHARV